MQYGCYHCLSTIEENEVTEWVDNGKTPVCPICGIDSLLKSTTEVRILEKLYKKNFVDPISI